MALKSQNSLIHKSNTYSPCTRVLVHLRSHIRRQSITHFFSKNTMSPAVVDEKQIISEEGKDEDREQNAGVDELLAELRQDEDLSVFLEDGFEPEKHVGQVVREGRIELALRNSERAHEILSARVREEVIERKEALIAEVEAVAALEKEVGTVTEGVTDLSSASSALVKALEEPYFPMETAVVRMQNLCDAADLLAALSRFRICTKKLDNAGLLPIDSKFANDPAVLPSAAEAMKELETLIAPSASPKLDKVDGLLKTIMAVRKASPEIRRRSALMLKTGLAERNQVEVEAAVSAFYSLGVLPERVNTEITRLLSETQAAIHRGLEAPKTTIADKRNTSLNNINNATKSVSDLAVNQNVHIWGNIEKMLDSIAEACCKSILVQQVLSKKYDDVTHLSLLHEPIAANFIDSISKSLQEQIGVLCQTRQQRASSNLVFLALAEGFPKLRASLSAVVSRIEEFARLSPAPITNIARDPKRPFVPNQAFIEQAFFTSVMEIETHYLTVSLGRLMNAVESAFKKRKQPSESEALTFAKLLAQELTAAKDDAKLLETATSNVATALRLYKSHAEDYAAATAPDVDQRKNKAREPTEWRLLRLHNGIVTLATYARRVLGVSAEGNGKMSPIIAKEVEGLTVLAGHFLDGPFSQCRQEIERALCRMHSENLELDASDEGCSVYVMDVGNQLSQFADNIITPLARSLKLGEKTLTLAANVIQSFVRHASLLKPISDVARMSLSTDIARLELSIESLCPIRGLGASYKGLRAMRSMLLIPIQDLAMPNDAFLSELRCLPKSCVACALISRANSNGLELPHERKEMSVQKYVEWIGHQTEEVVWQDVEESMTKYEAAVREEERCEEYKAMKHLLGTL